MWKADADLSVPSHQTKVVDNKPHGRAGREAFQPGSIRMVMAGTGCENAEKVEQVKWVHALFMLFACVAWHISVKPDLLLVAVFSTKFNSLPYIQSMPSLSQILEQVNGDVDAAIEFLIAEQGTEECSANSDSLPNQANTCGNIFLYNECILYFLYC